MSIVKRLIRRVLGDMEEDGGEPSPLLPKKKKKKKDARIIGLLGEVEEEKIAEIIQAILFLQESGKEPVEFYISTYGGNADDMFCLYDMMNHVKQEMEIHTIGIGKVMSAGVLLLAAGTKGKRKISKNCRVMIHSVIAGNHGSLHNLVNEIEAIQELQESYIQGLADNTKMTKEQIKKMLERKVNIYLSAEEAIQLGIADELM